MRSLPQLKASPSQAQLIQAAGLVAGVPPKQRRNASFRSPSSNQRRCAPYIPFNQRFLSRPPQRRRAPHISFNQRFLSRRQAQPIPIKHHASLLLYSICFLHHERSCAFSCYRSPSNFGNTPVLFVSRCCGPQRFGCIPRCLGPLPLPIIKRSPLL